MVILISSVWNFVPVFQVYASMSPIVHIVNVGSATKESLANVNVRSSSIVNFLLNFFKGVLVKSKAYIFISNSYIWV